MKLPVYIRQGWQIMLRERQYSLIYIIGTALSMAVVSAMLIFFVMLWGNVYPENHRGRTMILSCVHYEYPDGSPYATTSVPGDFARIVAEAGIDGLEAVSVICPPFNGGNLPVGTGKGTVHYADVLYVDSGFWIVFGFDFLAGTPFMPEMDSGPEAVISSSLAQKCFGTEDAIGRILTVGENTVTVCGVVRDVSVMASTADAEIWLPRELEVRTRTLYDWAGLPEGGNQMIFRVKERRHFGDIREAVNDAVGKFNAALPSDCGFRMSENTEPVPFREMVLGSSPAIFIPIYICIIVAVLLIPAVNLCGMVSSGLQERISEFGVRKSYGAPFRTAFFQIFSENMVLTFIGSILGFILSIGLLEVLSGWFVSSTSGIGEYSRDVDLVFPVESFYRPSLFLLVLAAVVLLNIFSSVQPVVKTLRRSSVDLLSDHTRKGKKAVKSVWVVTEASLVFIIAWLFADPLLLNAVRRHAVPAGWVPDHVICVPVTSLSATDAKYSPEANEDENIVADFRRIGSELAGMEGVEAVAPATAFFPGNNSETRMTVYTDTAAKLQATCFIKELGTDFMDVFGFGFVAPEGNMTALPEGTGTVIISEDLAESLFPGNDPVGKTLYMANGSAPAVPKTVAGVILRQKVRTMTDNPRPTVIVNMSAFPADYFRSGQCCWTVRLSGDTDERQFLENLDYGIPSGNSFGNLQADKAYRITDVLDSYGGTEIQQILLYYLLINLVLGSLSHFLLRTRWRIDELGVRMAMGASPGRILLEETLSSLKVAAISCSIGLFVILNIILFSGRDTVSIGQINMPVLPDSSLAPWPVLHSDLLSALYVTSAVVFAILSVNVAAALLSVWKASRMRPSDALREE